jgi:CCR4-NOT transcriptional regulation complex NOT5 subunit
VEISKSISKFESELKKQQKKLAKMKDHIDGWNSELKKLKPKKSS